MATIAGFAADMRRVAADLAKTDTKAVAALTAHVAHSVEASAAAAGLGGHKITRVSQQVLAGSGVVKMVDKRAHLVERDTKAHKIVPSANRVASTNAIRTAQKTYLAQFGVKRKTRLLRTGGRRTALLFPQSDGGLGYRAYSSSKGTKGKHIFERGVDAAAATADAVYAAAGAAAIFDAVSK